MPAKCLHLVEWFASAARVECGDVQETLPSLIYSGPLKWEGYECVSIPYTERISITYVMASNVRAHSLLRLVARRTLIADIAEVIHLVDPMVNTAPA